MKEINWSVCPSDKVGDVLLIGIYGGAICNHYRLVAKVTETAASLVRVNPISSKNSDGTFSTKWETA